MRSVADFHSHILPAIDDGSQSITETMDMLRMEAEQGIATVVATPHFYAHRDKLERFLKRREQAERLLRSELAEHPELPEIVVGAEVHYFTGIGESELISELVIGNTKYILVEMPQPPWTEEMYLSLFNIYGNMGLTPIIAHIDRYITRFRTYGIPKRLKELPVLVQANAEFFLNRGTTSMAMKMLRSGGIHLLGSDCHNLRSRKPNLGDAVKLIEERLGSEILSGIAENEQRVLSAK